MSALENELITLFRKMDSKQQLQLVENIRKDLEHPSLSLGAWLQNAEVDNNSNNSNNSKHSNNGKEV